MIAPLGGRRSQLTPAIFVVGLFLITVAWLVATPPAGAPEEPDHYLRAISVAQGEWLGRQSTALSRGVTNPLQAANFMATTRVVHVPPGLGVPTTWYCLVADHGSAANCLGASTAPAAVTQLTDEGTFAPYTYYLPGRAALLGAEPASALYLARAVNLALPVLLLALAVWLAWSGDSLSLLGIVMAASPAVLWVSATLSPSAAEIAAGVCLSAAVIRAGRGSEAITGWWWLGIALGGSTMALARPLGPAWLFAYTGLLVVARGLGPVLDATRRRPVWAAATLAATLTAVGLSFAWQAGVPRPISGAGLGGIGAALVPALSSIPETIGEEIGVFGWVDTLMPRLAYGVWGLTFVAVVTVAVLRGRRRDFRVFELALIGGFVLRWLFDAGTLATAGGPIQGRHVLPVTVAVSMLAGETIFRNHERIPWAGRFGLGVTVVVVAIQAVGWYSAAHRFAVGSSGAWFFLPGSLWSPPGGWLIPGLALLAGTAAIITAMRPISPGQVPATEA